MKERETKNKMPRSERFWSAANGHLSILRTLRCTRPVVEGTENPGFWIALQNTICIVIELSLKAAISTFPNAPDPRRHSHNIGALHREAKALGILSEIQKRRSDPFETRLEELIGLLGDNYTDNDYRYMENSDYTVIRKPEELDDALITLKLLIDYTAKKAKIGSLAQ